MRVAELFAGIAGFRIALERLGHKVVWANDFDRYAGDIYEFHYGKGSIDRRDLRTVPSADIPDIDLLVGGPPCQSWSASGLRGGFSDERGQLLFEYLRVLRDKRPRYFVLENVKHLLSTADGEGFQALLGDFADLGYVVEWSVVNSKNFGVPQHRERVFFVGHLAERGGGRPQVFPLGDRNDNAIEELTRGAPQSRRAYGVDGLAPTLTSKEGKAGGGREPKIIQIARGKNMGGVHDVSPTLTSNRWEHNNLIFLGGVGEPNRVKGGKGLSREYRQGFRIYDASGIAATCTAQPCGGPGGFTPLYATPRVRRLTPIECEALQGFPRNWTAQGIRGPISDSRRYATIGNAVTVPVVEAIIRRLDNNRSESLGVAA